MKIHSVTIEGFRGIRKLSLEFDPSACTVIVGENGCGKSSVVDFLALMLSPLVEVMAGTWPFEYGRVTLTELNSLSERCHGDIGLSHHDAHGESEITWEPQGSKDPLPDWHLQGPVGKPLDAITNGLREGAVASIPIAVYYPVDRYVLDSKGILLQEEGVFHQVAAYEKAVTGARMDFQEFFKWFRYREDVENEHRIEDSSYRDKQMEAVRNAIAGLYIGFSQPRVRRNPPQMILIKKDPESGQESELQVEQLSGGQKGVICMVGDLARRLAIANPGLEKPLEGEGVVLIDEIDLHLHPKWQRMIIPALTRIFPNCQFIVTTHSPQVMSEVETRSIYLLHDSPEGIKADGPLRFYGRDSNRILEELGVGERPDDVGKLLREYFHLVDANKLEEAKQKRGDLEEQIGADEPELARADVLIRAREILGS